MLGRALHAVCTHLLVRIDVPLGCIGVAQGEAPHCRLHLLDGRLQPNGFLSAPSAAARWPTPWRPCMGAGAKDRRRCCQSAGPAPSAWCDSERLCCMQVDPACMPDSAAMQAQQEVPGWLNLITGMSQHRLLTSPTRRAPFTVRHLLGCGLWVSAAVQVSTMFTPSREILACYF